MPDSSLVPVNKSPQAAPRSNSVATGTGESNSYRDYTYAKGILTKLMGRFQTQASDVEKDRNFRWLRDVDGHRLRSMGILKAGEGFYPYRVADNKIRREQPQYLEFLTQSRRSAIFELPDGSSFQDSELLENDFTNRFRFTEWSTPFIRWIDGQQAHGWDFLELVFDPSKPGHFAFEHLGNEFLGLDQRAESLEAQEMLPRAVNVTPYQLDLFVKTAGFNEQYVRKLVDSYPEKDGLVPRLGTTKIYKVFFKEDGIVWVGWFHQSADGWLKDPSPLFLGRRDTEKPMIDSGELDALGNPVMIYPPLYETEYPFVLLKYIESEDPRICFTKGRIRLDESTQEAVTVLNSSLVNKARRASFLQASPAPGPNGAGVNAAPKQTDTPIQDGTIWNSPMDFTYLPAPTIGEMGIIERQLTLSFNADAQVNYAALNREDTEKTATEIMAAKEESNKLSGVQITLLSNAIRIACTKAFAIYQNRVAQGAINVSARVFELLVEVLPGGGIRCKKYTLKSSGDIDVVKRAETLQKRKDFWPLIVQLVELGPALQSSPLALEYVKDLLRETFPEDGQRYVEALKTQSTQVEVVTKMAALLKSLVTDPAGNIEPAFADQSMQIQQLLQQASMLVGMTQQPGNKPNAQNNPGNRAPAQLAP